MLARRLPTILPEMDFEESLETTKIYSICGKLNGTGLIRLRPFRAPHHTATHIGLIGGGNPLQPGEISLAHNGVLFLDELPEFSRNTLEVLRQPLEDGRITLSRAREKASFPAEIMLAAAMNPCPCGRGQQPGSGCCCSVDQIIRYRARISGPLMDRIDIHIAIPAVPLQELKARPRGTSSEKMRRRIVRARQMQKHRGKKGRCYFNSRMTSSDIHTHAKLCKKGLHYLESAMNNLQLSARAYIKIVKISRTIADLEGQKMIKPDNILEAIDYRRLSA